MSEIKPFPYQKVILRKLNKDRKKGKTLVVIPSGAGKTHIAAYDSLQMGAKNVLYICHRLEILQQAAEIFKQIWNITDYDIGFITQKLKQYDKKITFATNSTLVNHMKELDELGLTYDYVVIDEFHHVAADTYVKVLDGLNYGFMIGLTATPYRLDGKDIMKFVDNNLSAEIDLQDGIKREILVPFIYNGLYDDIDYSDIEWQGFKYRESDLDKKLLIDRRDKQIIREFKNFGGDNRQTIVFCVTVKHTQRLTKKFRDAGISARDITYDTPYHEREKTVHDFREKKFNVLLTRDIFNEGVDFPEIDMILFLRPTWSKRLFFQQLGRGLRKREGKKNVVVLDFMGNYHNVFQKKEWLEFAESSEDKLTEGKPPKPQYEYDVPRVYFDKKLIDIFDIQYHKEHFATKEELIQQYWQLREKLKRPLMYQDFAKYGEGKLYTGSVYQDRWGSWKNFMIEIGEYEGKPSKDDLIQAYLEYKANQEDNTRIPRARDLKPPACKYNYHHIIDHWGDYTTFLRDIGEIAQDASRAHHHNKQTLIDNYNKVKKALGRNPTSMDINKHPASTVTEDAYRLRWGSWTGFQKAIGVATAYQRRKYFKSKITKEELIGQYKQLKKELGHVPTNTEWRDAEYTREPKSIRRRFGSWREFVILMEGSEFENANCEYCHKEYKRKIFLRNKQRYCSENCYQTSHYRRK